MVKRWQCTVCGYIHIGDEPPETCPVCGADRSQFIPLEAEAAGLSHGFLSTFKLHPVAAHFPGGLIPTAVFFVCLSWLKPLAGLENLTFWLVLVATAVVPVSIGSGLRDWRQHFNGRRAAIFIRKIVLALTLLTLGLMAIATRPGYAGYPLSDDWSHWFYLFCLFGMLGCVFLLGHYGAILVSERNRQGTIPSTLLPEAIAGTWPNAILTEAPEAILAADVNGIIRLWNHGAERIFGTPATEAIGQSLDLIIPETLRQRHWEGWGKVMHTGESRYGASELLRVPALRGDGSRFSAEFSIVILKGEAGNIAGVAAILRDVTEQRDRETTLKAQLAACRQQLPATVDESN